MCSRCDLLSKEYNQRGPLETPFFRHFLRLVLSCINADFCVQGRIFQHFSSSTFFPLHHSRFLWFFRTFALFLANSMQFLLIFLGDSRFCNFSSNFSGFFPEFRRISMISERVMSRFSYFREIWENLPKIFQNSDAKLLEICPKKMDPLNPHGGNSLN